MGVNLAGLLLVPPMTLERSRVKWKRLLRRMGFAPKSTGKSCTEFPSAGSRGAWHDFVLRQDG
jgi:hypothetical protein